MFKKAFTLIELLVVIAVIALLLSITVPALQAVKARGRSIVCKSNISQLSMSMLVYNEENQSFPHGFNDFNAASSPSSFVGNLSYDKLGLWWFYYILEDYLNKKSIAWCPSRELNDISSKNNILCENYGVNRSICKDSGGLTGVVNSEFIGRPLSSSQIRNPSQTLLLVDSGYSIISWKAACSNGSPYFDNPLRENYFYIPGMTINKDRSLDIQKTPQAIFGRHPDSRVNVGYVDGHVDIRKADKLEVKSSEENPYNPSLLWKGR